MVYDTKLESNSYLLIFWNFEWQRSCYLDVFQDFVGSNSYWQAWNPTFTFSMIVQSDNRADLPKRKHRERLCYATINDQGNNQTLSVFTLSLGCVSIFIHGLGMRNLLPLLLLFISFSFWYTKAHQCTRSIPKNGIYISLPLVGYFFGAWRLI